MPDYWKGGGQCGKLPGISPASPAAYLNKACHRSWLAFRFSRSFPSFTYFVFSTFTRVGPPARWTWTFFRSIDNAVQRRPWV